MDKSLANELIEIDAEHAKLLSGYIQKNESHEMEVLKEVVKTKSWVSTQYCNFIISIGNISETISSGQEPIYSTSVKLSNEGNERVLIPVYFNGIAGSNSFHFFSNLREYFSFWNFENKSFTWKSVKEMFINSTPDSPNDFMSKYNKTKEELVIKKEEILKEDQLKILNPKLPHELLAMDPPLQDSISEQNIAFYQITSDNRWYFCKPGKWLEGVYDQENGGSYGIPLLKSATTIVIFYYASRNPKSDGGCIWGRFLMYQKSI